MDCADALAGSPNSIVQAASLMACARVELGRLFLSSEFTRAPLPGWRCRVAPKDWAAFRPIYQSVINKNLTIVIVAEGTGFRWTEQVGFGRDSWAMANAPETKKLSWPWWAPWALLAVAATSLLTIAATLYDIL